jgi:hypothetical protein
MFIVERTRAANAFYICMGLVLLALSPYVALTMHLHRGPRKKGEPVSKMQTARYINIAGSICW